MQVFKMSECITQVDPNGTTSITLPNQTVIRISSPEVMALSSKVCAVMADQAQVPADLIQMVQNAIQQTDLESNTKLS